MKTVKLITCDDAFQAHIIQGALANEGIDSLLHNENMSTLLRGFVHDISGVDVLVADCDYEAAMQLLRQNQMIPEEQKFCPFCGSDRIKFVLKGASCEGCQRCHCFYAGYCPARRQSLGIYLRPLWESFRKAGYGIQPFCFGRERLKRQTLKNID